MTQQIKILVVDDDKQILSLLSKYLSEQGFAVIQAETVKAFREKLRDARPDFVILDVKLPDGNGMDACRDIRSAGNQTPLILLTANKEEVDRILGLEIGADDYMSKPFSPRELLARIKAVHRRTSSPETRPEPELPPSYRFDGFIANPATRTVVSEASDRDLQFTGGEFDVLMILLARPNRLVSREQIIELTHGYKSDPLDRSVDVLISRIRKKLKDAGGSEGVFKTVRNSGYQLSVKVEKLDAVILA
ncbi:response regulator transcription factor [Agrobacterium rubi]|nr:response regulator transcription factor [Agrobacterium rubi]NTF23983.1 response regulator transcription factor [Agrobacterium rubi]